MELTCEKRGRKGSIHCSKASPVRKRGESPIITPSTTKEQNFHKVSEAAQCCHKKRRHSGVKIAILPQKLQCGKKNWNSPGKSGERLTYVYNFLDHWIDEHANHLDMKGIGELGVCGTGATVFSATGIRVRDYPTTMAKLLPGLPAQRFGLAHPLRDMERMFPKDFAGRNRPCPRRRHVSPGPPSGDAWRSGATSGGPRQERRLYRRARGPRETYLWQQA
jgi:hypothetical protein